MTLTKCCSCVNLLTGVKILGIVLTTLYFMGLISYVVLSAYYELEVEAVGCMGIGFASGINLVLVIAASKKKRLYLLPW